MKVETIKQKNSKFAVSLLEGDLKVTKGLYSKQIDATKEAERLANLYGCHHVLSVSPTCQVWS